MTVSERHAPLFMISRSTDATCPLLNLPEDIVRCCILPVLDPISLLRFSLSCRKLYEAGTLEMELRCRKAGFTHPRGELAWNMKRSPARSRRLSPYAKRSPRKTMSLCSRLLAGIQHSPLSGPVIHARLPSVPRSCSFLDRVETADGVDPSPAKEEHLGERIHEAALENSADCNSPSPNVTPKTFKQQCGTVAIPSRTLPSGKRQNFASFGINFGLSEELAARVKKQEYYRRKFYDKFLTPLCCLCWGENGSGRPHPFFSNRPVCYTCFCQTKYVLSGFGEVNPPEFRYIETFFVSTIQVCNYRFPSSWIHERSERIITLSVDFRADMAQSLRMKYNKYLEQENQYLTLSACKPDDETGQRMPFLDSTEPDREQSTSEQGSHKHHPQVDEKNQLNKHELDKYRVLIRGKIALNEYEEARADLYRFYYSEIYPLAKRTKEAEQLLEQAVPFLKNERLWRLTY